IQMIRHKARLQVLCAETSLSVDRLSRLYRDIHGVSPPKGMLPYAPSWFVPWEPNLHSSLIMAIYQRIEAQDPQALPIQTLLRTYEMYGQLEEVCARDAPIVSFTRAWMLLRYIRARTLALTR